MLALGLSAPLAAQGGRPDQVFLKGGTRQETGSVIENGLADVVLTQDGKEKRLDASRVERIIWGAVGSAFREGQTDFARGDYENAAAKYALAASEDERPVIQAVARKRAGEALLRLGAKDPSQYDLALETLGRFLSDHPSSRLVPEVRALQARATLLRGKEGDLARAGALYRSLFEAGSGTTPTQGYDRLASLEAGLLAVRALTDAGETLAAREVAGVLAAAVSAMSAEVQEGSRAAADLRQLGAEVRLAEGFVLLASQQGRQAETFFKGQLQQSKEGPAALRYGAMLGLGRAYFDQEKYREASVQFATVAAIDYTDRDRTAGALLHFAETQIKLGDKDGPTQAKIRLTQILESFGDTPSASTARKLLEGLG
jgi:outer membrane protein assembly factor BamD (BamD/ComL family)